MQAPGEFEVTASVEDTYMVTRDLKKPVIHGLPPADSLNESQSQQGEGCSRQGNPSVYHLTIWKTAQWLSCARLCASRDVGIIIVSALKSSRSGGKHWEVNRRLGSVWQETLLVHRGHMASPQTTDAPVGKGDKQKGTSIPPPAVPVSESEGGAERVKGFMVRSRARLETKTARHSLTQRLRFPNVSGLATGLPWPSSRKYPKASPSGQDRHSYSPEVKINTQRPQGRGGKTGSCWSCFK